MRKIITLFVALIATTALWASNVITYTASSKLLETTSSDYEEGLHVNAFNVAVTSHSFSNGQGTITFAGEVVTIGRCAFYRCDSLKTITIPSGVTSIGYDAFESCQSLTSVDMPSSVTNIYPSAFSNCTSLTSITIPSGVKTIESSTFSSCRSLTSVAIPSSVISIGSRAFAGCTSLFSVSVPSSVTSIGERAFYLVNNVVYSGTATGSPWGAKCINGYIEGNLIYSDASKMTLYGCSPAAIGNVSIPNSVVKIGDYAFYRCNSISSVTFGSGVTNIGESAFGDCSSLASVSIPNSVTHIGEGAFEGCTSFTSIVIPNNVKSIGAGAFYGCKNMKTIDIQSLDVVFNEGVDMEELEYELAEEPIAVQGYYLVGLPNIETMTAPAVCFDVPEVGWVGCCNKLKNVRITTGELTYNVLKVINRSYKTLQSLDVSAVSNTTLADEAFKDCYNIETLKLPSNLEYVPFKAVAGCLFLKSIDIPASVVEIEPSAFEDCRSIQTITFGGAAKSPARMMTDATSALKKIGNWAFYNAHELQNLTIPEGVEEIGDGAFYGCTYLEDLKLPSTVREIGDNCFALCSKMTKITVTSMTPPTIYAKTFYDVNRAIPVYVPDEAVDSYKGNTYWKEFDIRGGATGIVNVNENANVNRKIIRDGQLYILRDGKTYNAQGGEL